MSFAERDTFHLFRHFSGGVPASSSSQQHTKDGRQQTNHLYETSFKSRAAPSIVFCASRDTRVLRLVTSKGQPLADP